ncbi:response regulator transcription factor [Streptomyces sp. NPDC059524]|uniref:response regulator transcription factor n=1 Tax=Streptomyces sp. NPDC059524 TaxID=3346856 RepID=UPI00368C75D9
MSTPTLSGPSASSGGPAASLAALRTLPRALSAATAEPRTYLTAREKDTLRLAANGKTNHAIARELGLSEETVKTRMQKLRRKLRADDRAHAVAIGLALGLLRLEDVVVPPDANRGYRPTG